jgi:hypothetical protein
MARRAVKDTYGYEQVSPDATVRRKIVAGQFVPDGIDDIEDPENVVEEDYVAGPGLGAASHEYPHQRGGYEDREESGGGAASKSKAAPAKKDDAA